MSNEKQFAEKLGSAIRRKRERMADRLSVNGLLSMKAYSDLIDDALRKIFERASEDIDLREAGKLVAIAAVGGYGRSEMSPFSDVDVTFIVSDEDDINVDRFIKRLYRLIMDVLLNESGLKVGYSYRRIDELKDLPLEVETALLDARLIVGSEALFSKFYDAVLEEVSPAKFVIGHKRMRGVSYERWGSSPYKIEPNVKEGCGGLRDIHTLRWITQIAFNADREGVWKSLMSNGLITDSEIRSITNAVKYIAAVRNSLHVVHGREADVLSEDRRREVAVKFNADISVEEFMQKLFASMDVICRMNSRVMDACLLQSLEIEPGVFMRDGRICITDGGLLRRDPNALFRFVRYSVELGLRPDLTTLQLIRGHSSRHSLHGSEFLRVLSERYGSKAVGVMYELGIVESLIPELKTAMTTLPSDKAHVMTVGAHSLMAAGLMGEMSDEPDLRDAFGNIRDRDVVLLAGLLHDIGKIDGRGRHPEKGEKRARTIGARLGMNEAGIDKLVFLIRHHLLMSETARMRDLNDYKTVERFISTVDTPDRLDMLFVLSAADINAVGQKTWSGMQMRFLKELYHRASDQLRRSSSTPMDIEKHRSRIIRELSLAKLPQEEVEGHCGAMPAAYLLNTTPEDLALHVSYVREARAGNPVVSLTDDPTGRFTEITICVLDDPVPGLLARITGVMYAIGIDVHSAQVFTRESYDRVAIDILHTDFEGRVIPELKKAQIKSDLDALLKGERALDSVFKRYGKKEPEHKKVDSIRIISHISDQHSVIEISAKDRPGLLYGLTSAISDLGWDIHSARVSTWGDIAHDAFYVTSNNGRKLGDGAEEILWESLA